MKNLKTCLESALDVPEPPKPEKDKRYVVMQGPLSTVFALTLMKRFAIPEEGDVTETDVASQNKTNDSETMVHEEPETGSAFPSTSNEPPSLSMEMQMSYIDDAMTRVEIQNEISQNEIAEGQERFRQYFQTTLHSNFVYLDK